MKMKKNNLIIIGSGSLGVITLDAALEMNCYKDIYFVDDNKEKDELIQGYKVIGGIDVLNTLDTKADYIIAIANNKVRKNIAEAYQLNYVNIIHPNAVISRFAKMGLGNIILSNTSIDPNVELVNHVVINKNNSIGHDSILNDYSQVSPGCSFGGFTELKEGVFIGLGSSTIPSTTVGNWSTIGAGGVVTKDIPSNVTAVGIPARIVNRKKSNLIIIGAGGHSKVVQDIVTSSDQYKIYAILDDAILNTVIEKGIIYSNINYIKELDIDRYFFVIAIGDNPVRKKIVDKLSIPNKRYATLIHPSVIVSKSSEIKSGTVIMPRAVINADTIIGNHSIINTDAVIEHDNQLDDFVHISPGAILSGRVRVDEEAHLGSGSIVIPGIKIGSKSIIGAGAVVTKDIPSNVTAVGIPAKIIKE